MRVPPLGHSPAVGGATGAPSAPSQTSNEPAQREETLFDWAVGAGLQLFPPPLPPPPPVFPPASGGELEVQIPRFVLNYQQVDNPVTLRLRVKSNGPVPPGLAAEAEAFLKKNSAQLNGSYGGFWERLNDKLVNHLLDAYPRLTSLASDLRVDSSELVPGTRTSTVEYDRSRSAGFEERSKRAFFTYHMPMHHFAAVENQVFDYDTRFEIDTQYSGRLDNYLSVHEFIDKALSRQVDREAFDQTLAGLPDQVRAQFPFIKEIEIGLNPARGYFKEPGAR